MKNRKQKQCIAVVLMFCLLLGILFANTAYADIADVSLYCNDEAWYKDARYKLYKIYQVYFVPASLFDVFDDVQVVLNKSKNEFMITNSANETYVSFNVDEDMIITHEGTEMYLKTYIFYGDEYYVPAEFICSILGLSCEMWTEELTGDVSMRIVDGSETMNFSEVLAIYDPDALLRAPVDDDPLPPPVTDPPPSVDDTVRNVYLAFHLNGANAENTGKILKILREKNITAAFFVTESFMKESPSAVMKIFSQGHIFGISTGGDVLDIAAAAHMNDLLRQSIKTAAHLVYESTEADEYTVCRYNFAYDDMPSAADDIVAAVKESIVSAQITSYCFPVNAAVGSALPGILDFVLSNSNYSIYPVTDASAAVLG